MKGFCDQSSPQMGLIPPNNVGKIAQLVRNGKGMKKGKLVYDVYTLGLFSKQFKMSPGNQTTNTKSALHISPDIYLIAEENPGKPQSGHRR